MKVGPGPEPEKSAEESQNAAQEKEKAAQAAQKVGRVEVFDDSDAETDDFGFEDLNLNSADVLVPLIPGNESGYDSSVFVLPKEEAEVAPKPAQSTNTSEEVQIVFSVP